MQDVVKALGHLSLGTRFKRIGETLQAQAQAILADHGLGVPVTHFPLLAALDRLGPLGVGELSQAIGVSQPGVTRALHGLEASGLVASVAVAGDRRVRRIDLSAEGRALVTQAKEAVWPVIEAAVAQACAPLHGPLLTQLEGLETALQQVPLRQRVAAAAPLSRKPRTPRKTPTP